MLLLVNMCGKYSQSWAWVKAIYMPWPSLRPQRHGADLDEHVMIRIVTHIVALLIGGAHHHGNIKRQA